MTSETDNVVWQTVAGAMPARRAPVDAAQWVGVARAVRDAGGLLLALWASDERDRAGGFLLRAALQDKDGLAVTELPVSDTAPLYPSLAEIFPAAGRMQRAAHDLVGVRARGDDARPWLRHEGWPEGMFPLRRDVDASQKFPVGAPAYPFVQVAGEGVHEIAVGPVHAGIIEPGHFRFSVVGEKVLRLEERLGYVHKGIEKRFESLPARDGQRLAARVSGDSAAAFSWAYCAALEAACGITPPARALWLRALCLERERIANHLGDLGALGNDAGFAVGLAQFSMLKEKLLRSNVAAFGSRYPMDYVVPGGVARDLAADTRKVLLTETDVLVRDLAELRRIYDDHAGMQDRFIGAGRVKPELASRLGLTGFAGRASSQLWDLRCDHPCAPYDELAVRVASHGNGDVAARVTVRFDEIVEALRLCREIILNLPDGDVGAPLGAVPEAGFGIGCVEGWRGPVLIALDLGAGGSIRRCHAHDPSWQNWPVLEHAVMDNIVPDFPLINKSFNLSYSGHDL
jgi:Ni,Fe-hydrogenase III large subunit/Ni,Fe-hydrogenase III component G